MSVKLFAGTGAPGQAPNDVVIVTDCLQVDDFALEFSEALLQALHVEGMRNVAGVAMVRAMRVAFKVAGYKQEDVTEKRVLSCGPPSYSDSSLMASSEKDA